MKKSTLFVVCILAFVLCTSLVCFAAPPAGYQLLLDEEFEGDALNTDLWVYRAGSTNKKENVRVADGKLYIDYYKVDDNKTKSSYTGGGVITKETFPYGYYETKAKVYTGARGLHTSFWTAGHSTGMPYLPHRNSVLEIDGFEFDSQDNSEPKGYYNLHHWWATHGSFGSKAYDIDTDGDKTNSDEFVIGFEYLPGKIVYYCNGVKVGETANDVYGAENVWLTALAWTEQIDPSKINDAMADENGLFGSSEYDYFKFYQKKLKGVNLLSNGHFEYSKMENTNIPPRCYYTTGTAINQKTPFAHSGICAAAINGGSTLGQCIYYVAEGNYTFEGYFKAKENTVARMVVYDKRGNEIKSIPLSAGLEWTKVSMTDIAITDSAYVVIEVTSGLVMVDDLSFFCQEGEEGYESFRDTNYEQYNAIASSGASAIDLLASGATIDAGGVSLEWVSSSAGAINGEKNIYAEVTTKNYDKVSATWTTTIPETGTYDLNAFQLIWDNNVPEQYYTVTLDGTTILNSHSVTTKSGSTTSGAWIKLCSVTATKGQTLTITLKPGKPSSVLFFGGDGYMRITPLKLYSHDTFLLESAFVAQVNNPVYLYKSNPYAFDVTNTHLTPYNANDELYIPYQAIKSIVSVKDVADDAVYVSASQIQSTTDYNVYTDGSYVLLYEKKYTPSDTFTKNTLTSFRQFSDRIMFEEKFANYVGKSNVNYQEVWDVTTATLSDGWGKSSLGYQSNSRYNSNANAKAEWVLYPKTSGKYSIQFYSIAHDGLPNSSPSTTTAIGDLGLVGRIYSYTFNQYNGQTGWYDLGTFDLDPSTPIHFTLTNGATGHLRANAMRLVPVFDEITYYNNADKPYQVYADASEAAANGTFVAGEGEYEKFSVSDSSDASLTFTLSPDSNDSYYVQVYAPKGVSSATTGAKMQVVINGESHDYIMNQTATQEGWYTLDDFKLSAGTPVTVTLSNFTNDGTLYAKGVRLIPTFITPTFVNDKDALNQEYYGHSVGVTTGAWQASGGEYAGCITASPANNNQDAAIEWTVSPAKNTRYSVQVYVPKYTDSGTSGATATLTVNGVEINGPYTLYQRADSAENTGNGWYDLGVFDLATSDVVKVNIKNRTFDGWLRAKAIRLVPENASITLSTTQNLLFAEKYSVNSGITNGEWMYSGGDYAGCIASNDANATVSWNIVPKTENKYAIEVFLPKYSANATEKAAIDVEVNGKTLHTVVNLKADSGESNGAGWYTLGAYDLKPTDDITLTISNQMPSSWLRARDIRIIPQKVDAVRIADFNEPNQEAYSMSVGVMSGKWSMTSGTALVGCFYGSDDGTTPATVTWNMTPQKTQKYSVQVYVPCMDQGSTTNRGYVTLTIDGVSHTFDIDERKESVANMGWYDLGVFDLSPASNVSVKVGKYSGTYIRAKAARLIPYPGQATVTQSGTTVTANIGTLSRYQDTFLFAEFDADGILQSIRTMNTAPTVEIPLADESNKYQLFFWGDNFNPATLNTGNK